MTKLKDSETRVTIGDSRENMVIGMAIKNMAEKNHHGKLSDTSVVTGLRASKFCLACALQKVFKMTSEGETIIL